MLFVVKIETIQKQNRHRANDTVDVFLALRINRRKSAGSM